MVAEEPEERSHDTPGAPGPVGGSARSVLAWGLAGFGLVGLVANEALSRSYGVEDEGELPLLITVMVGAVAMGTVGALVASRTRNPIGWMLLAIPAGTAVSLLADTFAKRGAPTGASYAPYASWLSGWPFFAALLLPVAIVYLFPTGTVPSRRWRWPWRVFVAAAIVTVVGFAVQPQEARPIEGAPPLANPFGIEALEPFLGVVLAVAGITLVLSALVSLASLAARYRRAGREERQQLRWLFVVGGVGAFLLVAGLSVGIATGDPDTGLASTLLNVLVLLLALDITVGIPLATGIAIFRYHLYDLNVVVRRAVVVASMAVIITAAYLAIVLAVPVLIGGAGGNVDVIPLLAAAVIAVTFDPLRRAARRLADRIVYGERATPYEVLTAFGERVAGTYSSDDVLPRMAQVLAAGTGATRSHVWLRVGSELRRAATWPPPVVDGELSRVLVGDRLPSFGAEDVVEVRHQGELLGALSVEMPASDPMDPAKEKLLRDVAAQAGLLLRNVRLIEELRASRQRLVAAQDEERRRLERNIHDGVQQQLVALSVQLGLLGRTAEAEPSRIPAITEDLQRQANAALEDLRDLARGIYPPLLADRGLASALEAQSRKAALPVSIQSDGIGRYDRTIEAAVYFSCLEALNNVAKYADASRAIVTLAETDDVLRFTVEDDGGGFDASATSYGTGLQGIADRLDAIGGRLEVISAEGSGTTVRGTVPVRTVSS